MSCHDKVAAALAGKVGDLAAWADLIDFACATGVPAEVIAGEILDDLFWETLRERLGDLDAADRALVRMLRGRHESDLDGIVARVREARAQRGRTKLARRPPPAL